MDNESSIVSNYMARLDDLVARYEHHLASGAASDYADYKNVVGLIAGVQAARIEFKDLLNLVSDGEDDGYDDLGG